MIERVYQNGKRYYKGDKGIYPSVTWILEYYPKGKALINWLAANPNSKEIMEAAGEHGSNVHKAIEDFLIPEHDLPDGLNLTEQEYISFKLFRDWYNKLREEHKVEVISNELYVVNEQDKYGGTIDLILKIDDQIWIIDFKTNNHVHITHRLQLAAYKHALILTNLVGDSIGYGVIAYNTGKQREKYKTAILHISDKLEEAKFIEVEDYYDIFLAVRTIWEFENNKIYKSQDN